ncbi:hypothetical protein ACH5RR_025217 [Cinchona calisaya]|uniref:Reverse transcriptase zinc-binding domain-containing protein n=1 Tax=Cinchona calisaya TaxID=153742 RepID=A0ABD2Z2E2_9GENT
MIQVYLARLMHDLVSHKFADVCSIIDNGVWKWPQNRRPSFVVRRFIEETKFDPGGADRDSVRWLGHQSGMFSVASAVKIFREHGQQVNWYKLVWFKKHIPRCAFIMSLLCKRKLWTKDRMLARGIRMDDRCVLYRQYRETIDHMFFECPAASIVWQKVLSFCYVFRGNYPWGAELNWLVHHQAGSRFANDLFNLKLSTTVYYIWRCRNEIIFQNHVYNGAAIVNQIVQEV